MLANELCINEEIIAGFLQVLAIDPLFITTESVEIDAYNLSTQHFNYVNQVVSID